MRWRKYRATTWSSFTFEFGGVTDEGAIENAKNLIEGMKNTGVMDEHDDIKHLFYVQRGKETLIYTTEVAVPS
jgi:hypothetical protein